MKTKFDAVIVGGGPNGLSAAVELGRAGLSVCVLEKSTRLGGGARTAELTLPGFHHDICSAIHPMAALSPFFNSLPLTDLNWISSPISLAHPFDDGSAACLFRGVRETGQEFDRDAETYARLIEPFVQQANALFRNILAPVRVPHNPLLMARFGRYAMQPALRIAKRFSNEKLRALFGGCSAHSIIPLSYAGSAAFGLVLSIAAHRAGWPFPEGGSQKITESLEKLIRASGGQIELNREVRSLSDIPSARAILLDLTPLQVVRIAGDELGEAYCDRLMDFRYGPGVFKIDWALSEPIPWKAAECRNAATIHLGNSLDEIAHSENAVWNHEHPESPFVILAQPSLFDSSRAPAGQHTAWAYCHVPHGSTVDMNDAIERQVERFAPGFRDVVMASHTFDSRQLENHNPNLVGGDISGGANTLWQVLMRPVFRFDPYSTPNERIFICSSSTPPGAGVHGMCGYLAARSVLRKCFGVR